MGTRADFYIKKADEKELVWLASIAWDGYPDGIDKEVLEAKNQANYISALQKFLSDRTDVTLPENGWPWPWDNSKTTDFAYCFIPDGKVVASSFGGNWHIPNKEVEDDEYQDDDKYKAWEHDFPDMSKIKNVRYDKGSGLIVISMSK